MESAAIRDGMAVFSADGKKLGKIIRHDNDTLVVEKGLFFKKDYVVGYDDIARAEGNTLWLRLDEQLLEGEREEEQEFRRASVAPSKPSGQSASASAEASADEARSAAEPETIVVVVEEEVIEVGASPFDRDKDPNTRH
jgi:hypothetical protein